MSKFFILGVALLITSVSANPIQFSSQKAEHPAICPMHSSPQAKAEGAQAAMGHDHEAMMAKGMVAMGQDPGQDPDQNQDTPTHRYSPGNGCSAVDPNAKNPRRDGVNPNTVGCKCAKKCVNGQSQEDLTKDDKGVYICSNACHKDRCSCPDPCKS